MVWSMGLGALALRSSMNCQSSVKLGNGPQVAVIWQLTSPRSFSSRVSEFDKASMWTFESQVALCVPSSRRYSLGSTLLHGYIRTAGVLQSTTQVGKSRH
jgi:hypothetical protein